MNSNTRSRVVLVKPWFIPRNVEAAIMSRKYHAVIPAATLERTRRLESVADGEADGEPGFPCNEKPTSRPTNTEGRVAAVATPIVVEKSTRRPYLALFFPRPSAPLLKARLGRNV